MINFNSDMVEAFNTDVIQSLVETNVTSCENGEIKLITKFHDSDDLSGILGTYEYTKNGEIIFSINTISTSVIAIFSVDEAEIQAIDNYGLAILSLMQFQSKHPNITIKINTQCGIIGNEELFDNDKDFESLWTYTKNINEDMDHWFLNLVNWFEKTSILPDIITLIDGEYILNKECSNIIIDALSKPDDDVFEMHETYQLLTYTERKNLFLPEDILIENRKNSFRIEVLKTELLTLDKIKEIINVIQTNVRFNYDLTKKDLGEEDLDFIERLREV